MPLFQRQRNSILSFLQDPMSISIALSQGLSAEVFQKQKTTAFTVCVYWWEFCVLQHSVKRSFTEMIALPSNLQQVCLGVLFTTSIAFQFLCCNNLFIAFNSLHSQIFWMNCSARATFFSGEITGISAVWNHMTTVSPGEIEVVIVWKSSCCRSQCSWACPEGKLYFHSASGIKDVY